MGILALPALTATNHANETAHILLVPITDHSTFVSPQLDLCPRPEYTCAPSWKFAWKQTLSGGGTRGTRHGSAVHSD